MSTVDDLIRVANELWERRLDPPPPIPVSPWQFDFLTEVGKGKTFYLAGLRADLNERRRREAAPTIDPRALDGIARSVWTKEYP